MLKRLLLLIISFEMLASFFPAVALSGPAETSNSQVKNLLVMGDSLSAAYGIRPEQGWVNLLSQRLQEKNSIYQVINASISGETTQGGLRRFPDLLTKHQPTLVILELGANDGLRGLSLEQMCDNLAMMIEKSQKINAEVVLLGMKLPPNYGKAYTERFQQIYSELAKDYQLELVPFFLAPVIEERDLMQDDGLHPTATAQIKLLEPVWEILKPRLLTH